MPRQIHSSISPNVKSIAKIVDMKDEAEHRIDGHPGLVLRTYKSGAAAWWFIYRVKGAKQRKLKIGDYSAVSLATAVQKAKDARANVGNGIDPRASAKASLPFKDLAARALAEHPSWSASTRKNYAAALELHVYPSIGNKPSASVTSDDIADICRGIKSKGYIVQAQRVKATVGGVYRWALAESYVKVNPARGVPNQQTVKSVRNRTPTDDELRTFWTAVDNPATRLSKEMRLVIKLAAYTGQRRSEVVGARVSEVVGDVWTIAADVTKAGRIVTEGRMKNGSEQRVYLSTQAKALFDEARRSTAVGDVFFPADANRTKSGQTRLPHMHGESVSKAVTRLCAEADIADLSIHDMRRAIGNFLKNAGYSRDVRDLVLHHKDPSVTGTHYDASATMEPQCRVAWQAWADHVSKVCSSAGDQVATV